MNDFNKPIRPISKKDDDKIKSEPIIEKFKEQMETYEINEKKTNKNNFIFSYMELVRKFFSSLFKEDFSMTESLNTDDTHTALVRIKKFLETIRDEDPAHDLQFAEQFSLAWKYLLTCHSSPHQELSSLDSEKIAQLIDAIEHYPPGEEHSLGFYLTRYSEKEWFPVPFFQILSTLHQEYWSLKKSSNLDAWIALAAEILLGSNPSKNS